MVHHHLHVVGVEEWVDGGVCVRQDDCKVQKHQRNITIWAESVDAVDCVQREPTDHEEYDDDAEVLSCLDLPAVCGQHLF